MTEAVLNFYIQISPQEHFLTHKIWTLEKSPPVL